MEFTNGVFRDAKSGETIANGLIGMIDRQARRGCLDLPPGQQNLSLWMKMLQAMEQQLEVSGVCQAIIKMDAHGQFKILNISDESSSSG